MREIKNILDLFKRKADEAADSVESTFNFTGQHTDIAAVSETGNLNASVIESIPDDTIRKNTVNTYVDAIKDGYLEYNAETRIFELTDKGQAHINSEEFIRQFEKDQLGEIAANKAILPCTSVFRSISASAKNTGLWIFPLPGLQHRQINATIF